MLLRVALPVTLVLCRARCSCTARTGPSTGHRGDAPQPAAGRLAEVAADRQRVGLQSAGAGRAGLAHGPIRRVS